MAYRKTILLPLLGTMLTTTACFPRRPVFPSSPKNLSSATQDEAKPSPEPFVMAKLERNNTSIGECGLSFFAPRAAVTAASCVEGARVIQLPDMTISTAIWRHPQANSAEKIDVAVVTFAAPYTHAYWPLASLDTPLASAQSWSGTVWQSSPIKPGPQHRLLMGAVSARAEVLVGAPILDGQQALRAIVLERVGAKLVAQDLAGGPLMTWMSCLVNKAEQETTEDLASLCRPKRDMSQSTPSSQGGSWQNL